MAKLTDKKLDTAIQQAVAEDRDALDELCADNLWRDDGEAELDELDRVARRLAAVGADADEVIEAMAALDEVDCEEDTAEEILPMVGLLAFAHRLAVDFARLESFVESLERTAQDQRARVRAIAPLALARAGAAHGPRLLERFSTYLKTGAIDSFVLDALALDEWLSRFDDPTPIVDKLDQVLRSCAKSPSWETVATYGRQTESMRHVPTVIAARFPDAVRALFDRWATFCVTGPISLSKDGGKDVKPFWQKGLARVAAILAVHGVKATVTPDKSMPAPVKKRDDSAPATGGDAGGLLPRLDAWLRKHRATYYAGLKPLATVDALAALEKQLGAPLPSDARALFAWKNGEALGAGGRFYENWSLMSAQSATDTIKELNELLDAGDLEGPLPWSKRWLPIFENGGGDHLVIDLDRDSAIVRFYHDDEDRQVLFPSLRALLHVLVDGVEAGAFAVEKSGLFVGDTKKLAKSLAKHAAGFPRPITV